MKKHWLFTTLVALALCVSCLALFPTEAKAASESDLTFTLNSDGQSYAVTGCRTSASGTLLIPSFYNEKPVTAIGDRAFYNCTRLTDIVIPDSVSHIGDYAFIYCDILQSVTIGNGVTSIGQSPFGECWYLTGIWVSEDNPNYSNDACGVLFNKKKTELICAPSKLSGNYIIPESVTSIGDKAFWGCDKMTSVTIGNGVTTIGIYAFAYCEDLTKITIPERVTCIGDYAFYYCTRLTGITIPESLTSIGEGAFCNCYSFADAYYSGTEAQWAQIAIENGNEDLISANIHFAEAEPTEPTTPPTEPLDEYWYLTYEIVDGEAIITDCDDVSGDIIIPATLGGYPVTAIKYVAFYSCENLTRITIPDSVTSIGSYAFDDCTSLTQITIPNSVTSIGDRAFSGCSSLTQITIPNGLTNIDEAVFANCESLNGVIIPDSVISIDGAAFYNCKSLTNVYYGGTSVQWERISIGDYNEDLTSARIHFESAGPAVDPTEPTTLPTEPTTPPTEPTTPPTEPLDEYWYLTYEITDGEVTITDCDESISGEIVIPDTLGGYPVTVIGRYAFNNCVSLTDITIPDSVRIIDYRAFYGCTELVSAELGNGLETIEESAFTNCDSLVSIKIPDSVTTIYSGDWNECGAFAGCDSLQEVIIGNGVKEIPAYTFYSCKNIKLLTIGNSVETIGKLNFNGSAIETLVIPDSVHTIGYAAFSRCEALKSVELGKGIKTIEMSAFSDCTALADVHYAGTRTEWEQITIGQSNECLTSANVHCVLETPTVKASNAANGVKITWNAISGAKNYKVYKSVYSGGKWSGWTAIKTGVTGTTYTDTSVKSNDNVKYTVRAFNGSYSSTYKSSSSIKFLATPTVTVSNATTGVKATWNAIPGAKTYTVYKSVYTGGKWSGWTAIKTGVTGTTYTDTTVKSNDNVRYTAKAINSSFTSYIKASSSIKFLATPTVKVSNATNGVKITWNAISGAKTYTVYKSVYTNGAWSGWKAIKTGVTGTTYTDTTVKSNDNVRYTAKAINSSFTSYIKASSSIKFLATPTVKVANAAKGVTVTWNKIAGAKTYTVYRSVYSGGKWSGWTAIKTGVTGTSYTDTAVKSGATVRYTVKAINGSFTSYIKASATTKFLAQPTVKVAKATNGIKASWGKVTGASGYIVYRRTYSGGKWSGWTQIKTTTALSYTDTTAKKGVTYQYTVRAYSGSYKSSYTNSTSIKR